jgi:hypothetical protein
LAAASSPLLNSNLNAYSTSDTTAFRSAQRTEISGYSGS